MLSAVVIASSLVANSEPFPEPVHLGRHAARTLQAPLRRILIQGARYCNKVHGLPDIAGSPILTSMALLVYSFGTFASEQSLMTVPFSHVLRFKGITHALQPTADF